MRAIFRTPLDIVGIDQFSDFLYTLFKIKTTSLDLWPPQHNQEQICTQKPTKNLNVFNQSSDITDIKTCNKHDK